MAGVFISYRRSDSSDTAGRLYDRLKDHFGGGMVFIDVDSIPFGVDYREHLDNAVRECDVLLAVIGKQWLNASKSVGETTIRRLDDPNDFVRIELESALTRKIPVIPVLIDDSEIPDPDFLPVSLRALVFRNAIEIRHNHDFNSDAERLIRGLERQLGKAFTKKPQATNQVIQLGKMSVWKRLALAVAVTVICVSGVAFLFQQGQSWWALVPMLCGLWSFSEVMSCFGLVPMGIKDKDGVPLKFMMLYFGAVGSVGLVWTVYLSQGGFSYWELFTGFLAVVCFGAYLTAPFMKDPD